MRLKIYTYRNCRACRQAVKWLEGRNYAFTEVPIRERPPSRFELETMFAAVSGNPRRLCNTSGRDYRALQIREKLGVMPVSEVIDLLQHNGNLIKRPFLIAAGIALVGFDESMWTRSFDDLPG